MDSPCPAAPRPCPRRCAAATEGSHARDGSSLGGRHGAGFEWRVAGNAPPASLKHTSEDRGVVFYIRIVYSDSTLGWGDDRGTIEKIIQ